MIHFPIRRHQVSRVATIVASTTILLGATLAASVHAGTLGARAAAPASGGSYTYRVTSSADCLDPQKTASGTSNFIDTYVFDTLLAIDNKGHYVGNLATKYKVSSGGTRITFTLRKNVRFSNGDPLTAKDVKFTFDRAVNPATKSPVSASQLAALSATKVVNDSTVQLDLKAPNRPLLTNLTIAYTGILDSKWFQAHANTTCANPVGSGPYKVQSTSADFSDVGLVANKRHNFAPSWVKNKGVPYVSKVNVKAITSDATAISALLSSGVDLTNVPGTQLGRVKGHSNIGLHTLKSQNIQFIEFNVTVPPFNDPQMRKAFAQLINRPAILQAALGGQGQSIYGPLAPGIPFYDKAARKYMPKYNPAAAAKTIAAKHAKGPYTYLTVGLPSLSTQAEILQQSAAQAGMQLTIANKSGVPDFFSDAVKGHFNVASLAIGYPDPDVLYLLLHSSQGGGKGLNFTGRTSNPSLDSLLERGRTTLSNKKKISSIYNQAQVKINQQLDFIGVVAAAANLAVRSSIKGYHVNATGDFARQDLYVKTK